ncbi:MAG: hypothetical protein LC679_18715 [Intrasporangiaceae bacterium]|nr:hypothetical protein [Intrasporangiaceae bacterium]
MRFRDLVSLLLGLIIAAGVAYGVWTWVSDPTEPGTTTPTAEPPPDPAEITAREYLDAWAAGDHLDMRDLVRDPSDDFVARHTQLRNGLEVTAATITPGAMTSDVDGRAAFPVTVALEVPYAEEPLTWETELNTAPSCPARARWSRSASSQPRYRTPEPSSKPSPTPSPGARAPRNASSTAPTSSTAGSTPS